MNRPYFIWILVLCIISSCREVLVSSADEKKEQLLIGDWALDDPNVMIGTIQITFRADLSARIVNTIPNNELDEEYRFHVEDGILFFNTQTPEGEIVYVYYEINSLSVTTLVFKRQDGSLQYYRKQ